jgi:pimeloyl-ACP methyl ester carboxylesterase
MAHEKEELKPETGSIAWIWEDQTLHIGYDCLGTGPSLLLLPAPSSISTRREMLPLQERLAPRFATTAIDWPGFGEAPRPGVRWSPEAYPSFLRYVLADLVPSPLAIVAAGHGASYALACSETSPPSAICLIAPTWRGPLPTVMAGRRELGRRIARLGDLPVLGSLLYRLNINTPMVRMMARGHVYEDANWLSGAQLGQKMAVTKLPGARHASIRFVTGMLDLMHDRSVFIDQAKRVKTPMLVIYGASTPRRSKEEMEALASVPGLRMVELPKGKLAIHEEFPDAVAEAMMSFLDGIPDRPRA